MYGADVMAYEWRRVDILMDGDVSEEKTVKYRKTGSKFIKKYPIVTPMREVDDIFSIENLEKSRIAAIVLYVRVEIKKDIL